MTIADSFRHENGTPLPDPSTIWRSAVVLAATNARAALPANQTRIDKALVLVLDNAVELLNDGSAMVQSQAGSDVVYHVNGACECADYACAPEQFCKHRLARGIAIRALQLAKDLAVPPPVVYPDTPGDARIPPQFLVELHGRMFILYTGLLHLAHVQGLLSLTVDFTYHDATVAIAHAVAIFADGKKFAESADSTPENVGAKVKPHWRRMALVRAKARCLRDALDVAYTCAEELE